MNFPFFLSFVIRYSASIAVFIIMPLAHSASQTWTGGSVLDGNWSTLGNWNGGAAPGSTSLTSSADIATFNAAIANTWGNAVGNPIVIDSATQNISGISFTGAAGNYTIGTTAGNALKLTAAGSIQILSGLTATNAIQTINTPLALQGTSYAFTNNSANGGGVGSGTLLFGGGITGVTGTTTQTLSGTNTNANTISGIIGNGTATSVAMTKSGAGTWNLTGPNSYTGLTTISAGALNIQNASALGSVAAGTSINSGAALQIQGGITTLAEALTLRGTGISATGALRNISGNNDYAGLVTLGSASRINSDAGTLTLSHTGTITGINIGLTVGGAGNTTIQSIIGTTGGTLTKDGTGTLTLSGASTYTGSTTANGGTLKAGVPSVAGVSGAFGNNSVVTLANVAGTTLDITGFNTQIGALSGGGSNGGNVTLGAATLTVGGNFSTVFAGVISGTGDLTGSGTGTLTLTNANTYTGATTINGSKLQIGIGSTTGSLSTSSAITIASPGTLVFNRSNIVTQGSDFATVISGTGAVAQDGAGTLILSGTNTYSGTTTVSAGVLNIQNASALGGVAAGTSITFGAALQIQGGITTLAEALTLNGNGISATGAPTGALRNISGDNDYAGLITLGSASLITSDAGTLTLSHTGTITGATRGLTVGGTGNTTIQSIIGTTTGTLTKDGTGTLTLSGASTYTGATTVNGGTLKAGVPSVAGVSGSFGNNSAVRLANVVGTTLDITGFNTQIGALSGGGSNGGNVTLGAATLTVGGNSSPDFAGVISGTGALTRSGTATLTLSGANTYTGATTISSGMLQLGSGGTTGSLSTSSAITIASPGTLVFNRSNIVTQGSDFATVISGTGEVAQNGTGTLILSGTNTYSGLTTISSGVLNIQNASALGGVAAGTSITTGAALQIQGGITTLAEALTLNGSGTGNSATGALRNISGNNNYAGLVTLGSASLITSDTGTLTLSHNGNITGNFGLTVGGAGNTTIQSIIGTTTGAGTLTKDGTGTLTLSGASTYTGETFANGGILQVNANNALGNAAAGTSVNSGASLKLNGVNYTTAEALYLSGSGISNGGALVNSGTSTFAGQITASTNASINAGGGTLNLTGGVVKDGTTLTLMGGGRVNITGTGISGTSANSDLVVDGTTVVVGAASNFNGPTTVQNSGTVIANAQIDTTSMTVSSNSTLSGNGGSITTAGGANYVYLNGTLQIGDSTLGAPVASSIDLKSSGALGSTVLGTASSSFLYFDLFQRGGDLTATAVASDYIRLFGNLDASLGGTLFITNAIVGFHNFAAGDKWQLFDLSNNGTMSGSLLLDYSSLSLTGGLIGSFDNGTGVFSISGVPEPSRALLMTLGLLGVMLRRRRA